MATPINITIIKIIKYDLPYTNKLFRQRIWNTHKITISNNQNSYIYLEYHIYGKRYMTEIKDIRKPQEQENTKKYSVQYHILRTSIKDELHITGIRL